MVTRQNRRTGRRICHSATFSNTNPIHAGLESSPSLRGDSQTTNPPESRSGPPFVLHLASLYWQTSCVDDRYDIYMYSMSRCVCHTWGELRVFQIGTFPALFLTSDLTSHFDETAFCAIHVCNYRLRLRKARHHKQPERPGSRNGQLMCRIS